MIRSWIYHNLEGVYNGSEASLASEKMREMQPDELIACRENLLKYCGLDTLAMVRVCFFPASGASESL